MKTVIKLILSIAMLSLAVQTVFAAQACDLMKFKNSAMGKQIMVEEDPVGLALGPKAKGPSVKSVLTKYARQNRCEFYGLSMVELVQGLLKGIDLPNSSGQQDNEMKDMQGKYILMSQRKHDCVKELGFKLPVKAIS